MDRPITWAGRNGMVACLWEGPQEERREQWWRGEQQEEDPSSYATIMDNRKQLNCHRRYCCCTMDELVVSFIYKMVAGGTTHYFVRGEFYVHVRCGINRFTWAILEN